MTTNRLRYFLPSFNETASDARELNNSTYSETKDDAEFLALAVKNLIKELGNDWKNETFAITDSSGIEIARFEGVNP